MKHSDFLAALKSLKSHYEKRRITEPRLKTINNYTKKQLSCTCKDSVGESKYLYSSQKEIEYILASKSVQLSSYPCPYEKGWHLTKN